MDFNEIQELIKLINKSNLTEFKMRDGDFQLSIRTKKYGRGKAAQVIQPQQQILPIQTTQMQVPQQMVAAPAAAPVEDKNTASPAKEAKAAEEDNFIYIKSPIVGTFYRAAGPDKDPFMEVSKTVEVGNVVCIVEAMKLFNEIESEVSGTIVEVLVDDKTPVEYDQPLFKVQPRG